ncbi:MAG TPA: hypothetical protein DCP91_02290, partial [Eggerthellaceae bacterium]|nr:hypothetical protein [Eggerthellaceae bacterium]
VDDVPGILKVAAGRWEIEECFRIMKHEMKARPVYLSREDRIRAHFLARFVALLACRIVEKRLGGAFTCPQVIDALRSMQMERVRGDGGNRDSNCQRRDFTLKPRSSTEEVGAGQKYYLHNFG